MFRKPAKNGRKILIQAKELNNFVLWFYTPTAMDFAGHLQAKATIFDCMDELSALKTRRRNCSKMKKLLEKS